MLKMDSTQELIQKQIKQRHSQPNRTHCKLNLFKGFELSAVENVLQDPHIQEYLSFDCVMVGDSFLTTYMGMDSTTMQGSDSVDLFIGVYLSMLMEMRRAIDSSPFLKDSMYLMADMPSGSANHVDKALRNAERMYKFGANTLKLEAPTTKELIILEELASAGYLVFAHVGYTPQTGGKKSRAFDIEDAKEILDQIKRVQSAGVTGIVLEGVSTVFLEAISKQYSDSLAIYSIFSGHAPCAGLSLNIWDCVYKPNFQAKFFPETATIDQSTFPSTYTSNAISSHFWQVCRSVIEGKYPKFRKSENCQDLERWLKTVICIEEALAS